MAVKRDELRTELHDQLFTQNLEPLLRTLQFTHSKWQSLKWPSLSDIWLPLWAHLLPFCLLTLFSDRDYWCSVDIYIACVCLSPVQLFLLPDIIRSHSLIAFRCHSDVTLLKRCSSSPIPISLLLYIKLHLKNSDLKQQPFFSLQLCVSGIWAGPHWMNFLLLLALKDVI